MATRKFEDEVAYVRFASVYRQFKDVETLLKEIESLLQKQLEQNTGRATYLSVYGREL